MSRIGKLPITIPENVDVNYSGSEITVKGKFGTLQTQIPDTIGIQQDNSIIKVSLKNEARSLRSLHGLYRTLINNMVIGVSEGWTKELELVGVGYRASAQGQKLELALGFSHSIVMNLANEVKVETVSEKGSNPIIKLTSFDKQLVGQVAAKIRSFRKPEPYKGKGIRFVGEQIRRKAGKQA